MNRLLAGAALIAVAVGVLLWQSREPPAPPPRLEPALWQRFAERFVTPEGRVVDRDNQGITHSEAQGYAMLMAEAAGDAESFDRLWRWTRSRLARPDGLFAWRFEADGDGGGRIADPNNASDGDVLIAWALLRAGRGWDRADYREAARAIAAAVLGRLVVRVDGREVLLPGVDGFRHDGAVVVNPSYWLFPAFADFAASFGEPRWRALSDGGRDLLRRARFGVWRLPPDWLSIRDGTMSPAAGFPPQYGFNAVRVPLHLAWDDARHDELLEPFLRFWQAPHQEGVPAWVDLVDGAVAPYRWQTGMAAVARLTQQTAAGGPPRREDLVLPGLDDGYFSWSLALLARIAAAERGG